MALAWFSVILLVAGLLLWFGSANPKVSEAGKWMFIVGLYWVTAGLSAHVVRLGPGR